jgi:hypothetical protein
MIAFGPDETASAVVYFCPGTTNEQIDSFTEYVLEEDAKPRHDGRDFPVFIASYFRVAPTQANGHDAVALTFRPSATQYATAGYLTRIESDARVAEVFKDVVPTTIHLDSGHFVDDRCR